jgi:hypothetical protein
MVVAKIHDAATAGTAVDLSELLVSFANDVLCHAVFGNFFREKGRNKVFQELVEANSSLLSGFNVEDYFPVLVRLDIIKRMVCAKAHKVKKMWDNLLDTLIDDYASIPASKRDGDENNLIDVLLSLQQECKLTRDHIKAQLEVQYIWNYGEYKLNSVTSPTTTTIMHIYIYTHVHIYLKYIYVSDSYIHVSICI